MHSKPDLSVVIPTLNEEGHLAELLQQLKNIGLPIEIIVVDGGSVDSTESIAFQFGARFISTERGRGKQLSEGAEAASGLYLLFLHADVRFLTPTYTFIEEAMQKKIPLASFPLQFDLEHWFLKMHAYFSRFAWTPFYFGDQGLWIAKELYQEAGGFDPKLEIMEDQEFFSRAVKLAKAIKFKQVLLVSSRKYRDYGVYRLQWQYYKLWFYFQLGFSRQRLKRNYEEFLKTSKPNDT